MNDERRSEWKEICVPLASVVNNLKRAPDPLNCRQSYESYLVDEEFDVVFTVSLRPKKTQRRIGMEMFQADGGEAQG